MSFLEKICFPELITALPNETIAQVLSKMKEYKIWTIPVTNDKGYLVGLLTYKDLLERKVSPRSKVKSVMQNPHAISVNAKLDDVVKKFYYLRIRALPVIDSTGKVLAIASREYLTKYIIENNYVKNVKISEVMTKNVITANPEDNVAKIKWIMLRNGITRVPIIESDKLTGIVTMRDLVEKIYYASIPGKKKEMFRSEDEVLAAPIKNIMTYPVITVNEDYDLNQFVNRIIHYRISGMPIINHEGKVVGICSTFDIIKYYVSGFKIEIPVDIKIDTEISEVMKAIIEKILSYYYSKLARVTNIINLKIHVKTYERKSSGRRKYSINIYLKDDYKVHTINVSDWDLIKAFRDAFDLLTKRVEKFIDRLRTRKSMKFIT